MLILVKTDTLNLLLSRVFTTEKSSSLCYFRVVDFDRLLVRRI